jgi:glyoxylase-like metal-dependent hydrolase (beta-lactamase superfamily II)
MFQIGDIDIYLFNDSTAYMDPGGLFGLAPRALWSRYYVADERHLIRTATHNLLIRAAGLNIIVDTGFGNSISASQRRFLHINEYDGTHKGLAALGIAPGAIDIVIDTHLHDDHCTGNFRLDADGGRAPAFPNAEYLAQRREYEDATNLNERTRGTYKPDNYVSLYEAGQLTLLEGDSEIVSGVTALVTPGHTPGHMSVRIESGGEHAAFLCDMASLALHFERLAWMTSFDVEPLVTLETKRRWQRWALETNALLIFPHDAVKPAGRLTHDERGRLAVQPIAVKYDHSVST